MNARQKAKKLKKVAGYYKTAADSWRQLAHNWERCAKNEATERHALEARIKPIYFFKLVSREEFEYIPEETIKRGLATEIGLALIDANLARWKTEEVPEMRYMRFSATIKALTQEEQK